MNKDADAGMTDAARLAAWVVSASREEISDSAVEQLKIRILDSLGCAIGALGGEPIRMVRAQVEDFGGSERCTLIGGGRTAPDRAAFYNGALVRYLDFNDSYLAKGETCHPSDNLAPVLAAAEYAGARGEDLHYHGRVRRDHRERSQLADRGASQICGWAWAGEGDV